MLNVFCEGLPQVSLVVCPTILLFIKKPIKYEEYEPNFHVCCKFQASCERREPPRFQLFCHHFYSEVILKTQ